MAIAPNTTFYTGYTLTATQLNAFPRGVMAFGTSTTTDSTITTEETQISLPLFIAEANRYYKITYYEPSLFHNSGSTVTITGRIRDITGVGLIQTASSWTFTTSDDMTCIAVRTFTAGPVTLQASLQSASGTCTATRSATQFAFLLAEDIGPA